MMSMEPDELRQMTDEKLEAELRDLQQEQSELRMQQAVAPPENPMRLRHIRRDIARIKTIQREREESVTADE